jgi:uncharacterized protein
VSTPVIEQTADMASSAPVSSPTSAALYDCRVRHVRRGPVANDFEYGTYQWLVDLDDLPQLPRALRCLARFRSADHLGDPLGKPTSTIRQDVDGYLAANGVDLGGGRIIMLTNARVLGHVFNPLSVFWCHDASGLMSCVIAEVHNTYGGRHCYLLFPDGHGRADAAKEFYVSPFLPVEGTYRMRFPEPGARLDVSIRLDLPGRPPFVAVLRGTRRPGTAAHLLRLLVRHPFPTLAVSVRIRLQGIRLYLRGLPVISRDKGL